MRTENAERRQMLASLYRHAGVGWWGTMTIEAEGGPPSGVEASLSSTKQRSFIGGALPVKILWNVCTCPYMTQAANIESSFGNQCRHAD